MKKVILILILTALFSCCRSREQDAPINNDPFSGRYFNSSSRHVFECIEINRAADETFRVHIIRTDTSELYIADSKAGELTVRLKDGRILNLYKNGPELRAYFTVNSGYSPEDVELTFYEAAEINRI